jgi:Bacterial PH domain
VTGPGVSVSGGTKVFRLSGPLVLWWLWVVFAAANLVDLAVQGRDWESVEIAVGLLAITAVVYVCTLRPRVVTDADSLVIRNPLREHRVPWGRVGEIYLSESVQVQCSDEAGDRGKLLHSWALYAPRRSRARVDNRSRRLDRQLGSRTGGYGQLPEEAKELSKRTVAETMAREIDGLAKQARGRGAAGGRVEVTWARWELAIIAAGWLAFILVITLR